MSFDLLRPSVTCWRQEMAALEYEGRLALSEHLLQSSTQLSAAFLELDWDDWNGASRACRSHPVVYTDVVSVYQCINISADVDKVLIRGCGCGRGWRCGYATQLPAGGRAAAGTRGDLTCCT